MKDFIFKKPIISSVFISVLTIGLTFIPLGRLFTSFLELQSAQYLSGLLEQLFVSFLLIVVIKKLGLLQSAGFTQRPEKIWLIWPMLVFIVLNASDYLSGDLTINSTYPTRLILYILLYLSTGLFEETLCRGLILPLLLQKWQNNRYGIYLAS